MIPMTAPLSDRPPFLQRLGARLALMVAVAMLPLGFLGLVQSQAANNQAEQRAVLALMDETTRAAAPEMRLIQVAQVAGTTLAQTVGLVVDDDERCSALMKSVAAQNDALVLVAYVPLSGLLTCASVDQDYDLSKNERFKRLATTEHPAFSVNPKGAISGVSVLTVTHPVFDEAGQRIGFISISLPHKALSEVGKLADVSANEPLALMTFDADGTVLTSSVGLTDAPENLPDSSSLKDLAKGVARTFSAHSVAGEPRIFSVVPMADGLFLLGSWGRADSLILLGHDISPYIFPILMWLSAMLVALLGAESLVARHMRRLSAAMKAFSSGDRMQTELDLSGSPAEIKNLGRAYQVLTDTILRDEAELENMLRQKEILLREVHHRTGNSLQLIASIMRIHMRQEQSSAVRTILEGLHDRVMALATVHISLYQTAGQKDVRMDGLFAGVIRQISGMGKTSSTKPQIETDFEPIKLIPDQAVPLALLLTELLAGMATAEMSVKPVEVSLRKVDSGQRARLHITGPAVAGTVVADQPTPTVIGAQLVRGFAQQIGGKVSVAHSPNAVDVTVEFPIRESFDNKGAA